MKFRIVKVMSRIRIVERQRCAANTGVKVAGRKRHGSGVGRGYGVGRGRGVGVGLGSGVGLTACTCGESPSDARTTSASVR